MHKAIFNILSSATVRSTRCRNLLRPTSALNGRSKYPTINFWLWCCLHLSLLCLKLLFYTLTLEFSLTGLNPFLQDFTLILKFDLLVTNHFNFKQVENHSIKYIPFCTSHINILCFMNPLLFRISEIGSYKSITISSKTPFTLYSLRTKNGQTIFTPSKCPSPFTNIFSSTQSFASYIEWMVIEHKSKYENPKQGNRRS